MAEPWSDAPAPAVERFGFVVRPVWRRNDPQARADAIAFWERTGVLPGDVPPAQRADELVTVAYKDGEVAAVSTATLGRVDHLRARFAIMRGATDPAFRRSRAQTAMAGVNRETLAAWARAHPAERVAGLVAAMHADEWGDLTRRPYWPESQLALAGYNADGSQLRLRWFDHFAFGDEPSAAPPERPQLGDYAGIEFREAWRRDDPRIEADAIAFWRRLNLLPRGASPEARVKELIAVAYHEGRIIGLMTASVEWIPFLRAKLAMTRGAIDPAFRRRRIGRMLMLVSRPIVENWSREHPGEGIAGLGGVIQAPELSHRARWPHTPLLRYFLAGFTKEGHQFRVSWFEDFRLD